MLGTVAALWRYPVKSMLGERCAQLDIDARGVALDRAYAVRDAAGKFGSGKNTRRFCRIDGLFRFRARSTGRGAPDIEFPDGSAMAGDAPGFDAALSAALGQPVTLTREAAVPHLDAGPVHLLTTGSLAALRSALPDAGIDERRFRPNLVVDGAGSERDWAGRVLATGDTVRLRVTGPTERCVMVTLAQDELPADPGILRRIAQASGECFGVYAEVVAPGTIRQGDPVRILP